MKVKFNRTVKHSGIIYEAGKIYDFDETDTTLDKLLEETHTDVFVRLREGEEEREVPVQIAEKAPEDAQVAPTPAPAEKTPRINNGGAMPALNLQG
jgi:hypothetical protein